MSTPGEPSSAPGRMLRGEMLVLRADPWMPEYGMGFEVSPGDEGDAGAVDPTVETADWTAPIQAAVGPPATAWFVDGVRRLDVRLLAEQGGRGVPGLFGSYAVGGVRWRGRAAFGEPEAARVLVLGGGLLPEPVEVALGAERLRFEPARVPGEEPDAPLLGLQEAMRDAEASLAARLAAEPGTLVLADGPLAFFGASASPVVGIVKRTIRRYLPADLESLVGSLHPRWRTPLFALGGERVRRYAWYTRLVELRAPWHDHAGIVRCEVRAGVGLPDAARLADRVTAFLPAFAGRPTDPRAPQNLAPVGALEALLRRRMGHPRLVRRALTEWLTATGGG